LGCRRSFAGSLKGFRVTNLDEEVDQGAAQLKHDEMSRARDKDPAASCFAALDLGTNNCRLLIARPRPAGFTVVDAFSRIVRLGEGLSANGSLSDAAMARTIAALRICSNKMVWQGVGPKRLIATEACRMAANGAAFIARIEEELGLRLEIINRETEARLAAEGALPLVDPGAETALLFDIGGGSTEIMWMERDGDGFRLADWTSIAAGVVTLSELEGGGRDVSSHQFMNMRLRVRELVAPFLERVRGRTNNPPSHLLGTSGTVTTIAGVHLKLRHYDRQKVDGCWMTREAVTAISNTLQRMTYRERVENGCIGRERADLVLAGCAILEEIREAFPADRLRVADRGLREGILSELMQAHGALA
jgi:exopolyphosphatase / guanosine-5'-triphosphate,3'-diphosphate pyrophosphatase